MSHYAVGVDVGGTSVKLALVSEEGEVIEQTSVPTLGDESPDATVSQIAETVAAFKKNLKAGDEILGIGIGVPGVVDLDGGTVSYPPNLKGWGVVRLGDLVKKATGYETKVENDANVAAFGEGIFGSGRNHNSFIMITLGTGVGGGIVIGKKIYRGMFGGAGEIGHISIQHDGPACNCGNRGCIERYIGQQNIVDFAHQTVGKFPHSPLARTAEDRRLEVKDLGLNAVKNDEFSIHVLGHVGKLLGVALTSMLHILDIRTFIIGGGVAGAGEFILGPAEAHIKTHALASMRHSVKLIPAVLGNNAGVLGAAAMVYQN